ncbi:hypothetical protein PybrP1_004614 [[Pythium] brassicae (nom. inval.)]|nr:hypothetical protein PybrP1_004614 [[Pythium] brassicae (nom. inval.)]
MAPSSLMPMSAKYLPRLHITPADEHELKNLADESLRETMHLYEEYLYVNRRQVDKARWKLVKEYEGTQVFKEREDRSAVDAAAAESLSSTRNKRHTMEIGPKAAMAANSHMPLMLMSGTAQGTIDDALYGVYSDDTSTMRTRGAYGKDMMEDLAMLASIETPTLHDPFDHLNVAWMLRDFPGLNAIARKRDFLLIDKMGTTTTSRGERVGYYIVHSIQHRDLPELKQAGIIRGLLSYCLVFRQLDGERIELFNQTLVDPGGSLMAFVVVPETAKTLLANGNVIHTAHKKKLFYFMRKQARLNALTASHVNPSPHSNSSSSSENSDASVPARYQITRRLVSDHCASCEKKIGSIFSSSGVFCQICQRMVCGRCSVKKSIVIEATERKLVLKPFVFCILCTLKAKNFPAAQIQIEELRERRPLF